MLIIYTSISLAVQNHFCAITLKKINNLKVFGMVCVEWEILDQYQVAKSFFKLQIIKFKTNLKIGMCPKLKFGTYIGQFKWCQIL